MKNFAEKIKRSLTLCLYVIALFPLFHNSNYSLSQAATASWSLTSNGNPAVTGNITATAVSKGPGRPDYGGIGAMSHTTDGVRSQNWNRSSYLSFSITSQYYNRDYYEYTVTPTPGNDFNITSVTLEASASTSTPSWFVYYSLDGFATYTQLGVRNSTSLTGLNITVPSGSTLTLRIFGMDLVSNTTYFRNKNVAISGTTSLGCSTPAQPSAITGSGTICATANGTYSVTNDPTATSYTWTLPSGWSGSSTTNSINATSGANGGTITVTVNNACGTSAQQTFNITTTTVPTQPSAITGNGTICATANGTYSVTNDPTATGYTWTLPSGWSGSSTINSINATSGANGGTITVTANNACGTSAQQTFNVTTTTVPTQPSAITGNGIICATANGTYSVTNDPTATSYTWTLPSGWSGNSSTNSINATSGANGGTITVTANNACGASVQQVLTITTTTIDNTVSLSGATLTANQAGATYQWINCTAGNTPVSGATNQSFTPASNGTYAVQITHNGCSDVSSCIVVSSVGIEAAEVNTFHVYPNPGTGIYTLSTQYSFEPSQVTIYTASGQLVNAFSISSQGQQLIVDISNQPEGIYMIFVHTPVTNFHVKIFKQ
ncbi:T9SS type A sorting domain-containing protein [Crocinitomicaceae bacterium CZZ-1]|uniref:T9SS type A sorting domain-containing protein n=1 Tax=Taishania pollutisoli TaxID=2766479 RepID=A0A8J6TY98_9FLAO|nr:T9SS type A sorting domain-containing protein [Taishania pollutisoli]MBC9810958.1 T9SS type A sorting domain-containing protein [Taishania pollutisoli]